MIKNFRRFVDSRFEFNRGLNLIIGNNGSGKSSLLAAITTCLYDPMRVLAQDYSRTHLISEDDVRFQAESFERRVRFEYCYPALLGMEIQLFGTFFEIKPERMNPDNSIDDNYPLRSFLRPKVESLGVDELYVLPLVAFYKAHRNTKSSNISLSDAAQDKTSRRGGYREWSDAFVSQSELQKWVIGKTLERLAALADGDSIEAANDDELTIVNGVVAGCIPGCQGLRYDMRLRDMMVEFDDTVIPFNSLSDGQKAVISLVADIARRMCILNPQLGKEVLRKTDGVLLVDEIDIHLHPSLQRKVIKILREAFPKIQIFATSHSPQMIGGLPPEEILIMKDGQASRPQMTYGLDSSRVLEDIMGTESRDAEVANMLEVIFSSIETGNLTLAKKELASWRRKAPDLPEYAQMDALIRRKEIIGK